MRAVSMENSGQWSVVSGQSLAILAERFGKCSRARLSLAIGVWRDGTFRRARNLLLQGRDGVAK
jgi:hypothetical protein